MDLFPPNFDPPGSGGFVLALVCEIWENSHCHCTRRVKSASPHVDQLKRGCHQLPHSLASWAVASISRRGESLPVTLAQGVLILHIDLV